MKSFLFDLDRSSKEPMYLQIFHYLSKGIASAAIAPGEKLPSLREASKMLGVSLTTVTQAYGQLSMEGYVENRPKSGYFVSSFKSIGNNPDVGPGEFLSFPTISQPIQTTDGTYIDPDCFDFLKWKKCLNRILMDYPHLLLSEGNPQGELALRQEIVRYVYQHRGVKCTPDQVVVGAGISPIIEFFSVVLKKQQIHRLAIENPGFSAIERIFSHRGFDILPIPVDVDGIRVSLLPTSAKTIVYVSPSNQFPLGSVMPVGKRYALLEWARLSQNYILEDDYDSELRYYGKPIPALKGMDTGERVIYLGSFSATLFPSIKISYMILPDSLQDYALSSMDEYRQTCSKSEQLALALYMKSGFYQTHIKKLRRLYAQKMHRAGGAIQRYFGETVRILQSTSGVHMLLEVQSLCSADDLCQRALNLRIMVTPVTYFVHSGQATESHVLIFYYSRIPIEEIEDSIAHLADAWKP